MQTETSIQQAANEHYASRFDAEQRALIATADDYNSGRYGEAIEELQEQPLSFQKIATYHVAESIEWEILLGTGGPADRILVTTDLQGTIEDVDYQYQDWFTPWTSAENQDGELLTRYAQIVGYYEES